MEQVLNSLLQLLGVVLVGVIIWVAKLVANKLNFDISASQEEKLRKVAKDAVLYVEEWASAKLKFEHVSTAANDKMNEAISFVSSKVPGVSEDDMRKAIGSALGSVAGLGSSKKVGSDS